MTQNPNIFSFKNLNEVKLEDLVFGFPCEEQLHKLVVVYELCCRNEGLKQWLFEFWELVSLSLLFQGLVYIN